MASAKEYKRRNKEILKEWKSISSHYAKTLKGLEDSSTKAGTYFMLQTDRERESLPGVQNDDIVLWQEHISRGQRQINGSLGKLRDVIKEHKNMSNFTKPGKVSLKKKSQVKLIKLEELFKHLQDYAVLVDGLAQNIAPTEKLIGLGNKRVVGGELEETSAEKLREELVSSNARWNKLNEKILRYVDRCDRFVLEILNNYKALSLWMVKADNMIQWLSECEKLLETGTMIANNQDNLEDQLHDNEEFLNEGREYQPSAIDVLSSGEKIYSHNRLDKYDLQYVNKTVIALRNRWNAIEEHLESRHNRIQSRLDEIKKNKTADDLTPWRQKADRLKKSLNNSQDHLDQIDARLKDGDKYETVKQCTRDIQKLEQQLLNQSSEDLTEVSSAGTAWTTKKQLSVEDDHEVQQTVNVLHDKMSGLEEGVKKHKERLQRSTANLLNQSVTDCEQCINEMDNTSLENFSAVGSDVQQVQKQIKDLQVFEERLEEEDHKYQQIVQQFDEASDENMLDENSKVKISYRLKEMDWRYKELWREHDASKQRILKGLLIHSNVVIAEANGWLGYAESQAENISVTDERDKRALEKAIDEQEGLSQDTVDNEQKIMTAAVLGKTIVKDDILQDQNLALLEEEMNLMEHRLENLKKKNYDNTIWLREALDKVATQNEVYEVVEASEHDMEVEAFPDELFAQPYDEGFDEENSDSPTDELEASEKNLASKVNEFNDELKETNDWINESNKMCDEFYKSMHNKDAWTLQEKIEDRYDELEAKQKQVDNINQLSKEITTQSTDEETSKRINEQMFTLNNNWHECQSMLGTACEVQVQRTASSGRDSGCGITAAIRRKLATICMYN